MTSRVFECRTVVPLLEDRARRRPVTPPRGLFTAALLSVLLVALAGAAEPPLGWLSAGFGATGILLLHRHRRGHAPWGLLLIAVGVLGCFTPRQLPLLGPPLFVAAGMLLVLWLANRPRGGRRTGPHELSPREREAQQVMGRSGEMQVRSALTRELSEDYVVIHGLTLPHGAGDIDHLVIGPSGVFLLETKTMAGRIVCDKDGTWRRTRMGRAGTPYAAYIGDPAAQVQRNIFAVRACLRRWLPELLGRPSLWIEGLVVFPHPRTELDAEASRVPAVRLDDVPQRICQHRPRRPLNRDEITAVTGALLGESERAGQRIGQAAQALVETALVLPLILALLFGTLALSRLVQTHAAVVAVAHEVARAGALAATPAEAQQRMLARVDQLGPGIGLDGRRLELTTDVSAFGRSDGWVSATVRYRLDLSNLPMISWAPEPTVQADHVEWIDPYRAGLGMPYPETGP